MRRGRRKEEGIQRQSSACSHTPPASLVPCGRSLLRRRAHHYVRPRILLATTHDAIRLKRGVFKCVSGDDDVAGDMYTCRTRLVLARGSTKLGQFRLV
jgi:hypothetical protein